MWKSIIVAVLVSSNSLEHARTHARTYNIWRLVSNSCITWLTMNEDPFVYDDPGMHMLHFDKCVCAFIKCLFMREPHHADTRPETIYLNNLIVGYLMFDAYLCETHTCNVAWGCELGPEFAKRQCRYGKPQVVEEDALISTTHTEVMRISTYIKFIFEMECLRAIIWRRIFLFYSVLYRKWHVAMWFCRQKISNIKFRLLRWTGNRAYPQQQIDLVWSRRIIEN